MDAKELVSRYEAGERDFRKAYLKLQRLTETNLAGVDLSESDLRASNLAGADLREANLRAADLRGAILIQANLEHANLHGAKMAEDLVMEVGPAGLSYANLHGTDLSEADLRGVCLNATDLREADLREANLRGAVLNHAYLHGANLSGADLREASLNQACLSGADLSEADLRGADLNGALVLKHQLAVARSLRGAVMPDGVKFEESAWFTEPLELLDNAERSAGEEQERQEPKIGNRRKLILFLTLLIGVPMACCALWYVLMSFVMLSR